MSSNTNRTFRAIMQQVGEDGRTSLRDLSPSSSYAAKESSLRQAQEAGLLTVGGNFRDSWVELTDAGYDWLATNVSTEFGD